MAGWRWPWWARPWAGWVLFYLVQGCADLPRCSAKRNPPRPLLRAAPASGHMARHAHKSMAKIAGDTR